MDILYVYMQTYHQQGRPTRSPMARYTDLMTCFRARAGRGPALTVILTLFALGAGVAAAQEEPDGGRTAFELIMGQAGAVLPSPDAGVTPASCRPFGAECGAPLDCCSQQCANGRCGDGARSCRESGLACGDSADCCSRFCVEGSCQ